MEFDVRGWERRIRSLFSTSWATASMGRTAKDTGPLYSWRMAEERNSLSLGEVLLQVERAVGNTAAASDGSVHEISQSNRWAVLHR